MNETTTGQPDPGLQAHLYNPETQPQLFEGVIGSRVLAFIVDALIILFFTVLAVVFTLGIALFMIGLVFPIIALAYSAITLGGPRSATVGMRLMGLEMRTWYGSRMYALLGAFHTLVFYFSISILTPLVLLFPFFNSRRRCLHDFASGAVVVNRL